MQELSPMPSIAVTIGGQLRVYHAFVTNAGPELDGPSTLTLYASTFSDLAGFTADPIAHDTARGRMTARLVLIETRGTSRGTAPGTAQSTASSLPADPVLVSLKTLQHWLWSRLQASSARRGAGMTYRSNHTSAFTARHTGELFRRSRYESSSSKSRRTTKATLPANSRMPSCISPTANSTA